MRPPAVAAALVGLLLVGCSGTAAPAATTPPGTTRSGTSSTTTPSAAPSTPAAPTPPTPANTSTTTSRPSDPDVLTMAFGGDIHFEDYLGPLASRTDGLAELQSSLGAADLAVANLETAITTRGTAIGKEFHFRAPASALATLAGAGIDAVSMANNHGVDFGPVGLRDTLAAKRTSPVPIVGIGADEEEAFAPAVLRAKGLEVAVFGASQVYEMTLLRYSAGPGKGGIASSAPTTRIAAAVRAAAKEHDLVVVFLHWGLDYQTCPDAQSTQTARTLEQAGADVVVGGHSHRVNGSGWLGRAYVHYGLGNFVWWRSREPDARSGVLTLSVDVDAARGTARPGASVVRRAAWTPMLIGTDGIPRVPTATTDRDRLLTAWQRATACSGLASSPS
jgi:Bacterial capsule synthesis protein PGA_cap